MSKPWHTSPPKMPENVKKRIWFRSACQLVDLMAARRRKSCFSNRIVRVRFFLSLSTLSFRFNFTCQNLAHSLLKMEKLRLKMNSMQQMMTCKHTQKSETPWKKNTIHTSHKHVTIFISLLDVFFLFSSKTENSFGSKFSLCSQFWWLDGFFCMASCMSMPWKYEAHEWKRVGKTISIRKCGISMWNFWFFLVKRKQKQKKKNRSLECCCCFPLCVVCACDNSCYCLNSFFLCYWCCGSDGSGLLLMFFIQLWQNANEWVSEWVCVFVWACRWRGDIPVAVASLTCLAMHILNFVQSIQWMKRLFPHSPATCLLVVFCLFWAVLRLSERRMAKRIHGLKKWQ